MFAIEGKTIRDMDRRAIEEYGLPGMVLMENAALRIVEFLQKHVHMTHQTVCVLAGKGNNGGDGIAVFRHLSNLGYRAKLLLCTSPEKLSGDAWRQYDIVRAMGLDPERVETSPTPARARQWLQEADVLVDALFGTGFSGTMREPLWSLVSPYNQSPATRVALDIPSGLDSDTGLGETVLESDYTVTLAMPKIGLFLDERKRCGRVYRGDISVPPSLLSRYEGAYRLLTQRYVATLIGPRRADLHKGGAGKLLIAGGKKGMSGAVALAAEAAVRSGAGLVSCLVPEAINAILEQKLTEAMTLPVETEDGALGAAETDELLGESALRDAMVFGPGLGRSEASAELVRRVAHETAIPLVLDADALFHLANVPYDPKRRSAPLVITPHEGEAARLLGWDAAMVKANRLEAARALNRAYGGVTVLKGARTIVCDARRVAVNTTGNPGMASGGSGDVLSGMLGALLARGMDAFEAAAAAVYLHGRAGDFAASEWGPEAMKAGDISRFVARAFTSLRERYEEHSFLHRIV